MMSQSHSEEENANLNPSNMSKSHPVSPRESHSEGEKENLNLSSKPEEDDESPITSEELIATLEQLLLSRFAKSWSTHFPPDGWDPITNEYNGREPGDYNEEDRDNYLNHFITRLTSFIYMPNRSEHETPSWDNIGRNFLGWEKNKAKWRENLNDATTPYSLPKNIFWTFIWTARNLLAFFTEFSPDAISILFNFVEDYGKGMSKIVQHPGKVTGYKTLEYVGRGLRKVFEGLSFAGKIVTTPGTASRYARNFVHDLVGGGILGDILGGLAWFGCVALTATIYFFLGQALIPVFVGLFTGAAATMGVATIAPVIFKALGIIYGIAGAVIGTGITIAGSVFSRRVIKPFRDWWYSIGSKPPVADSDYKELQNEIPSEKSTLDEIEDYTTDKVQSFLTIASEKMTSAKDTASEFFTLSPATISTLNTVEETILRHTLEPIRNLFNPTDPSRYADSKYEDLASHHQESPRESTIDDNSSIVTVEKQEISREPIVIESQAPEATTQQATTQQATTQQANDSNYQNNSVLFPKSSPLKSKSPPLKNFEITETVHCFSEGTLKFKTPRVSTPREEEITSIKQPGKK